MTSVQPKKLILNLLSFLAGLTLTTFVALSAFVIVFYVQFNNRIYPGVRLENVDLSGLTKMEARDKIHQHYSTAPLNWTFTYQDSLWNLPNSTVDITADEEKLANDAFLIGRNANLLVSASELVETLQRHKTLALELNWPSQSRANLFSLFKPKTDMLPIDAQFKFAPGIGADKKGRVIAFTPSKDGQALDEKTLEKQMRDMALESLRRFSTTNSPLTLPIKTVSPDVTPDKANELGIQEKLGEGVSYFYDSIPGRVYNISLGTEKINGSLVAPNEVFSFSQAIGTVSAVFGFQKAYAIINNKTVLDDGGGVCQVSTTLYRAVLNSGLPVVEREGHSYRVGFYEQGGFLPGLDATVYPPSPDFKFRNDTGNTILIQAIFDQSQSKLTFELFGKSDGRLTEVSRPVIISSTAPPAPIYEDDPNLPVGQIKRVDTAHAGAKVYFTRQVTRGGELLIDEKISTTYIPWPARYIRGTKS